MSRRNSIQSAIDRKMSTQSVEGGEKRGSVVLHVETDSVDSDVKEEVRQVTNLTAKEQYRKLWAAIKADRRFCLWTLYTMLLVFGWGYDAGLSGVAVAFPAFREYYGNYYADGKQWVIPVRSLAKPRHFQNTY